jgi:protein TonB
VVLLIEVGADGKVDNIAVFNSSGYEILDDAAKKAARKWRFKPALKYGEPVRRQTKIWFNFNLEG